MATNNLNIPTLIRDITDHYPIKLELPCAKLTEPRVYDNWIWHLKKLDDYTAATKKSFKNIIDSKLP